MSLKATLYDNTLVAPKSSAKFFVMLPGCPWSVLRVSNCSLPMVKHNTSDVSFLGRKVVVANDRDLGGTWTCTYDDDLAMSGMLTISKLDHMIGTSSIEKRKLLIFVTDEFTGEIPQNCIVLNDVFLKSCEDVKLDWSSTDVVRHKLTFQYSSLKRWY